LGKSEGWYFIEDLSGEAYGQIFIGLEIEAGEDDQKTKKSSDIELLRDSVFLNFDYSLMSTEDNIYKKHQANLSELDRVTKKMQNYLLTDQFEESIDKTPENQLNTGRENFKSNSLGSSLGRENEHI